MCISNRLNLLETMDSSINNKISEIEDKLKMIYIDKMCEKDIDKLLLIYVNLKKIIIQLNQDLKEIFSLADLSKK